MANLTKMAAALALSMALAPVAGFSQNSGTDATGLALGEQIVDGVAVGAIYERETHGDWTLRCVRTADLKDPCRLYQLMKDEQGNSVAEINVFQLSGTPPAIAGATIATPLETLLTEQLTVSIDGGTTKRYPFSYCTTKGCYARIGLTADDIAGFERGAKGVVTIVPVAVQNHRVNLTLSLKGFTAGFDALKASDKAAATN
jgi:invasion protein IalB